MKEEPKQRLTTAFQAAEESLKVPKMLDVDDVLLGSLDADSIITYLSNFNLKLDVCLSVFFFFLFSFRFIFILFLLFLFQF